jgi:uncharacterized protein YgiB involved in biofilm formation
MWQDGRKPRLKPLVVIVIVGVAGLMGYLAATGECPHGVAVFSEEGCLRDGRLAPALCREAFARADAVARQSNTIYPHEWRCLQDFDRCLRSTITQGFTPVPAGFCLRAEGGQLVAQTPLYRRINTAPAGAPESSR